MLVTLRHVQKDSARKSERDLPYCLGSFPSGNTPVVKCVPNCRRGYSRETEESECISMGSQTNMCNRSSVSDRQGPPLMVLNIIRCISCGWWACDEGVAIKKTKFPTLTRSQGLVGRMHTGASAAAFGLRNSKLGKISEVEIFSKILSLWLLENYGFEPQFFFFFL